MNPSVVVFVIDHNVDRVRHVHQLVTSAGLPAECYSSANSFVDDYAVGLPGCVVANVRMPEMSGVTLLRALRDAGGTTPVILSSGYGDVSAAVTAMKLGAFDFFERPIADQSLIECINRAITVDKARLIARAKQNEIRNRFDRLTPREQQVMSHVVIGQPNKTIAYDLGCSSKTIEVHRARVMSKMEAPSLAGLVIMSMALSNEPRLAVAV